ncbi:MAG TPA: metallophosphoesterase [Anaerolineae bacterium]|nr:metallophosphoesterase [Anaerolineae bacterium]
MRIAVLSDIHDNIWKLEEVLKGLEGVEALLFCGDFCAPFSLKMLADGFPGPIHVVFGNNDGDQFLLTRVATGAGNVTLHGHFADLTLGDRRIAVTHYPEIGRPLAASGQYDLVCHGHDHQYEVERVGEALRLNPGEVMGRFGASTYAIYDTETGDVQRHQV